MTDKNVKPKITVALSGGVDSGMTARLLLGDGYDVRGVTFTVFHGEGGGAPAAGAARLCAALGIPHRTVDAADSFRDSVIADFIREYQSGRTPNPCVVCNRTLKFPLLLTAAEEDGASLAATGHYARIVRCGSRLAVARAADDAKDQSYMLWQLPQETLARLVLPLGEYKKEQIREMARAAGLPCAEEKDSQDICFIPHGDYVRFLAESGVPLPPGVFTDAAGRVLGTSKNQACYTVGQRRSLGIALGQKMTVCARDAENNRVILAPEAPVSRVVRASGVRYMAAAPGDLDAPRRLTAKFRYARTSVSCTAVAEGDMLTVTADEAVRAPSPGQSLVLYDGDVIVAGGVIV